MKIARIAHDNPTFNLPFATKGKKQPRRKATINIQKVHQHLNLKKIQLKLLTKKLFNKKERVFE